MNKIIIGVDGGGTKTNLAVMELESGKITRHTGFDSINSWFIGMEKAAMNLCLAIKSVMREDDELICIAIGDPSIDDSLFDPHTAELLTAVRKAGGFKETVDIVSKSDVFMALYALNGGNKSVLIAAGTGSMGVALKRRYDHSGENELLAVGGWGFPTWDSGSGYYIASRAVNAAMDAFDGIAPNTALCESVKKYFGADEPRKLIGVFNGDEMSRTRLASFSKEVDPAADAGDAVASKILEDAGIILANYAVSLLKRMNTEVCTVGVSGSVLLHSRRVRKAFEKHLKSVYHEAEIKEPSIPPENGAALFAADRMKFRGK